MTGRYCFHRCLSVNISGGGVPGLRFSGGGVPGLRFSGGGGVTWSWTFRGGVPGLWLHGGRYASCVHAGGLSCTTSIFIPCDGLHAGEIRRLPSISGKFLPR